MKQAQKLTAGPELNPMFIYLQTQVDLTVAPDYHEFVKQEEEMWLHLIANKLRSLSYSDAASFLRDFEAIQRNCAAYNVPGAGKFGGPGLFKVLSLP